MNRTVYSIILFALTALIFTSCKEKPQQKEIIVPVPKQEVKKGTQSMQVTNSTREVEWLNNKYTVEIKRQPDMSLPLTKDEYGQDYYDNTVSVRVIRPDGSEAINKVFHKSDFTQYISDKNVCQTGALLGVVFDKVDQGSLVFAASVGSPNDSSDEFVPLVVHINRLGAVSVAIDTSLDGDQPSSENNQSDQMTLEDEGV